MAKILWISEFIPYDTVKHAGGRIHNYYLKALHKTGLFDIRLMTFANKEDMKLHDLDKYDIQHDIICHMPGGIQSLEERLLNMESLYNPYNRYGRALQNYQILQIRKKLAQYKKEKYIPEIVILQWTSMVFMTAFVRKVFPDAKIIAIEEDVTFLSYQRKMETYPNAFLRYISRLSYQKVKKLEIAALRQADKIILNNDKDRKLIMREGIPKDSIYVWAPFFQNLLYAERKPENHDIIFYGGMSRPENYLSAIWFADKVMPLLEDMDIQFLIIGANPDKSLYEYESDRIKVIGYVDKIEKYFEKALCLVAPLVLGAGVKIKILEAMSAGLPVLTNDIGIEGIAATDNKEYFYCCKPEEYRDAILKLRNDPELVKRTGKEAKRYISENYDCQKSVDWLCGYLTQLIENTRHK